MIYVSYIAFLIEWMYRIRNPAISTTIKSFNPNPIKRILLFVLLLLVLREANGQIQTAGSYLNVTRPNGGPIQNGDILEIRAVISIPSGTTVTASRFTDNVPTGTTYIANSIKTVTNEGVVVATIANT